MAEVMTKTRKLTIALAGNPNSGKTTIFNNITGARQHVGNWPGVTVEKKEGRFNYKGRNIEVVDLPGTYSLTAYSMEETIARDFIIEDKPEVVIDIVDASNLERNLYLAVQIRELTPNLIIALNMSDTVKARGDKIDTRRLSELIGAPVVPTVGIRDKGTEELIEEAIDLAENGNKFERVLIDYGEEIEEEIRKITPIIERNINLVERYSARWLAIKLLENDADIVERVQQDAVNSEEIMKQVRASAEHLRSIFGEDIETIIVDGRYGHINGMVKETLKRRREDILTTSDRIDKVVTNRILGIPIFLVMMWIVFKMIAEVSGPYLDWVDGVIGGPISHWAAAILTAISAPAWLSSLVLDGVIAGVGSVLVFIPVLFFLYFFIALLEDSGYMARAAFVMDRFMHSIGLHGKSFIPLLVGFGCTVPAIYATRTLENEKDRLLTAFLTPLMSCGARLPVYIIFAAAFFPQRSGQVIWAMYITGIIFAILTGLLFKRTLFAKKAEAPFVMELPPYRWPTLKSLFIHMWERSRLFVRKAGTIILLFSIIIWVLLSIPWGVENLEDSIFGKMSSAIAPIFKPLGFGNWEASGALVTGLVAKEVVISTMGQIYVGGAEEEEAEPTTFLGDIGEIISTFFVATWDTVKAAISIIPGVDLMGGEEEEETELMTALKNTFTPLSAIAFIIFVLLYVPCMVAVAAFKSEFGWKWALFNAGYLLVLAWVVSFIVYQGGRLIGFG